MMYILSNNNEIFYLDLIGQDFNIAQILDQYVKVSQLGLSGKVFKLNEIGTKNHHVIKILPFNDQIPESEQGIDELFDKIRPLKVLEHRNIVK